MKKRLASCARGDFWCRCARRDAHGAVRKSARRRLVNAADVGQAGKFKDKYKLLALLPEPAPAEAAPATQAAQSAGAKPAEGTDGAQVKNGYAGSVACKPGPVDIVLAARAKL